MNQKKLLGLIIGAAVIIGIAVMVFKGGGISKAPGKKKDMMSQSSDPTQSGTDINDGTRVSGDGTNIGTVDGAITPEFLLEQYKEWAQYPPHSRPMSNLNYDLVFPYKIELASLPMADSATEKEPNGFRCLVQPKTWAVIGESEMYVTLECRDSNNQTAPISILNHTMYLYKEWDGGQVPTHSADFNDDGRDGDENAKDNVITFRWRPMKNDWGQMILEINFTYGKEKKKAKLSANFFSSPNKPAEIANTFRESVVDGSLVVHSNVIVYKAGNYHLEANLKEAAEGNYISYAVFDGPLKQGTNEVDFLFYGKILRDKGYDGPYLVTDVRGHRTNLAIDPEWMNQGEEGLKKIQAAKTTEPDRELVIPYKEEYKTKMYNANSFTNKPWISDDKNRRIQELEEMARQTQK